ENFALDATKTGGAEINVPAGTTGKVFLAPVDDPSKPALDAALFQVVGFHVVRQEPDIVAGKALVKNLAPGRYEARAGDLRGIVEIVAGKTVDVTLAPPK